MINLSLANKSFSFNSKALFPVAHSIPSSEPHAMKLTTNAFQFHSKGYAVNIFISHYLQSRSSVSLTEDTTLINESTISSYLGLDHEIAKLQLQNLLNLLDYYLP